MGEDRYKYSRWRGRYAGCSKDCKSLSGNTCRGELCEWCTTAIKPAGKLRWWHFSGLSPEEMTALPSQQTLFLSRVSSSKPWGKIRGNSNIRTRQQDACTICHVVKYLKLCEFCRDSSHCQVVSAFLSMQDGKELQMLSCETPLASKCVMSHLVFLSDRCWNTCQV